MDIRPMGNNQYAIDSESSEKSYLVTETGCSCPHHTYRGVECKHMAALKSYLAERTPLAKAADKAANLTEQQLLRFAREKNGTSAGAACLLELACRQVSQPQPVARPIPAGVEAFLVGATPEERERALAIYR